jgi:hypothetical protein
MGSRVTVVVGCVLAMALVGPAASGPSRDDRIAQAGLLQPGDFTVRWQLQPSVAQQDVSALYGGIPSCKALLAAHDRAAKNARATSLLFVNGQTQVSNEVSVYTSTAAAMKAFKVFDAKNVPDCLQTSQQRALQAQLAKQTSIQSIVVDASVLGVRSVGKARRAYEVVITAQGSGSTQVAYVDLELVRVGRVILTYTFQDAARSPAGQYATAVASTTKRLSAAFSQNVT